MKKITVKQIMAWGPCEEYTESRVQELIGCGKTPFEILGLNISLQDRFWVLLHKEIIPESLLHLLACDFAEMVVQLNPDSRVQAAITAKRNWIDGEVTDEKLDAACAAARDAAWAARDAACAAARDAAWAAWAAACAARDAARAAASDAARDAAWAARAAAWAASDAAWAAKIKIEKKQIKLVKKVLEKMYGKN
jgi:hypothetical protein